MTISCTSVNEQNTNLGVNIHNMLARIIGGHSRYTVEKNWGLSAVRDGILYLVLCNFQSSCRLCRSMGLWDCGGLLS